MSCKRQIRLNAGRRPPRGRLRETAGWTVGDCRTHLIHGHGRARSAQVPKGSDHLHGRRFASLSFGENQNREVWCGRVRRRGGRADARRQERGPLARSRNDFGHGHCATTPDRASHTTLLYSSIDILSPAAPRVHYAMYAALSLCLCRGSALCRERVGRSVRSLSLSRSFTTP
jgi:hypothetical protein